MSHVRRMLMINCSTCTHLLDGPNVPYLNTCSPKGDNSKTSSNISNYIHISGDVLSVDNCTLSCPEVTLMSQ